MKRRTSCVFYQVKCCVDFMTRSRIYGLDRKKIHLVHNMRQETRLQAQLCLHRPVDLTAAATT